MNAQETAANVNKNLSSSLEKLSSGLRINKASDDSSGMAIADKVRTQASSLGQSISNANSGNALVQIADKAMAEQSNILDIVKTKLIQASTETTSAEGRESIRKDVSKLLEQLDNIAAQTNYNGINLLDTKGQSFSFQVGEDSTYDISMDTAYAANSAGLGGGSNTYTDGGTTLNDTDDAVGVTQGVAGEYVQISGMANTTGTGADATVEISSTNVTQLDITGSAAGAASVTISTTDAALTDILEAMVASDDHLTQVSVGTYTFAATAGGTTGTLDFGAGVDIANLTITGIETGTANGLGEAIRVTTDDQVNIERTDTDTDADTLTQNLAVTSETANGLVGGNLLSNLKDLAEDGLTSDVANEYMSAVDEALNQINTVRSDFGSTQNQLDSFIRNAMTTQTNIKAAESVIRDVDYAQESSNFNKQNIISQAGTYAMSQANSIQQNVLRLLQ
jgi:flagellin